MADETTGNGSAGSANGKGAAKTDQPPIQARILTQYIKDLSFEVPSAERLSAGPSENVKLDREINVNAQQLEGAKFESVIEFKATASDDRGTIYSLEITYGGLIELGRIPQEALEPFLLVNCPAMVYPYLRRVVSDLTRECNFASPLTDMIDFGHLYVQRKQQAEAAGKASEPAMS